MTVAHVRDTDMLHLPPVPSSLAHTVAFALAFALSAEVPVPAFAASPDEGRWTEQGLLQNFDAVTFYEPVGDRLVSLGGVQPGVAQLPLGTPPTWSAIPSVGLPPWLDVERAAWDPATSRVYYTMRTDDELQLWSFDPVSGVVEQIPVAGTSPFLAYPHLVYDPDVHRLLLINGSFPYGGGSWEIFAIDMEPTPTWVDWTPAVEWPFVGAYTRQFFDVRRRRVVVLPVASIETAAGAWTITSTGEPAWTQLSEAGLPTFWPLMTPTYDPAGDRVLALDELGQVMSFSLETNAWTLLATSDGGPALRRRAGLAVDPVRHRLLVCGGQVPDASDVFDDAWALSLDDTTTWTLLEPEYPRIPPREGPALALDPLRHRVVVFGGADPTGTATNDTWQFALGDVPVWASVPTGPPSSVGWRQSSGAFDPLRDQLLVFGGLELHVYPDITVALTHDVHALSFATDPPSWTWLHPEGEPGPLPRYAACFVRDSRRDRMLMMFGSRWTGVLGDLWQLVLQPAPTWIQVPASAGPAPMSGAVAVYDSVGDRVLVFGGANGSGLSDALWMLDLSTPVPVWTRLMLPNGPSGRTGAAATVDSRRRRLLLFGGYGITSQTPTEINVDYLSDTWELMLDGEMKWRRLEPEGPGPRGRDRMIVEYDADHDRMIMACGGGSAMNDTWILQFGDASTPTALALASADVAFDEVRLVWSGALPATPATVWRRALGDEWSALAVLVADAEGRIACVDRDVVPGATYEYRLGVDERGGEAFYGVTTVHVPERALRLAATAASGRARMLFALPNAAPASLELFDVAGRRVWQREVGTLGAGSHALDLEVTLAPALYFARLRQAGAVRGARLVLLR